MLTAFLLLAFGTEREATLSFIDLIVGGDRAAIGRPAVTGEHRIFHHLCLCNARVSHVTEYSTITHTRRIFISRLHIRWEWHQQSG